MTAEVFSNFIIICINTSKKSICWKLAFKGLMSGQILKHPGCIFWVLRIYSLSEIVFQSRKFILSHLLKSRENLIAILREQKINYSNKLFKLFE